MYMLMVNKQIVLDSIESEKEAMDKAFELSKNGKKVEIIKVLGEVVYEPHFKKVTPKKAKESKEVSKDSVSTEEVKIIMPKNEPSRVSNEIESPINPPKSFTLEHNAFLDNIPTLSGLRATTSDMRKSLEALFAKGFNEAQEPKSFISDNEIDERITKIETLSDIPVSDLIIPSDKVIAVVSVPEAKTELPKIRQTKEEKKVKKQDPVENIIHADIANKSDDIQKVVTIAIDKDSIKVIDVEDAIQEPISNPEIAINEVSLSDNDLKEFVEKQINPKSKDIVSEPVKEEIKALPEQEKTYICYLGATSFPMLETNLKKQCETKFKESLEKEDPLEALKNEKTTLMNWYKDTKLQDFDWFQHLYTKYIALASKKAVEKTCKTSDVISTDPLEELLREFEHRLKNANFDQGVIQIIINDNKYKELQIKKKDQFNELKNYYQSESLILDLVDALRNKDITDPESLVRKYSPKTQKDQRVIDALEARKKVDIEKLQKLNEVKKEVETIQEKHNPVIEKEVTGSQEVSELSEVETAIKEITEATKENFAAITNKYKHLYLLEDPYCEAVRAKEKEFNRDSFNELLKEIEGKTDIEVLRISSQIKYTYLENILSEDWNKNITPITHRAQVKELCDELIKTPLTKQKDLLNKYSKEIVNDAQVQETISNIRTAF